MNNYLVVMDWGDLIFFKYILPAGLLIFVLGVLVDMIVKWKSGGRHGQ